MYLHARDNIGTNNRRISERNSERLRRKMGFFAPLRSLVREKRRKRILLKKGLTKLIFTHFSTSTDYEHEGEIIKI